MGLNKECLEYDIIWQCWTPNISKGFVGEGEQSQDSSPVLDYKPSPSSILHRNKHWAVSNSKFHFEALLYKANSGFMPYCCKIENFYIFVQCRNSIFSCHIA